MADRDVLDVIEREIADEVRTRFPDNAVQRVRLLLAGDPEDWDRILRAFQDAHEPAIDSFVHYLTEKVLEIRIVEFMCGEDPIGREGHGPRFSRAAGARPADVTEWERYRRPQGRVLDLLYGRPRINGKSPYSWRRNGGSFC
jgi:hypothetical protein